MSESSHTATGAPWFIRTRDALPLVLFVDASEIFKSHVLSGAVSHVSFFTPQLRQRANNNRQTT